MTKHTPVTDQMIDLAWKAAGEVDILKPHMARCRDYDNVEDLQDADRSAERRNNEAMRHVLDVILNGKDPMSVDYLVIHSSPVKSEFDLVPEELYISTYSMSVEDNMAYYAQNNPDVIVMRKDAE